MACAVCVFIEFGAALPRSGGEKNYLERIFRKPKYLITCVMASLFVLFGGVGPSSIAFGSYVLHAAGYENATGLWETRFAAFGCVTFCVLLHSFLPKWGMVSIKLTAYFKLGLMLFIIISGMAALAGILHVPNPHNFDNGFAIEVGDGYGSGGIHGYARALTRLGFVYGGAVSVTYILGEFKNPRRVLFVATPLALITVSILYLLVNIAYFAAIPRSQFAKSDAIIAAKFFENMFGHSSATRVLPALTAVSNLGSILASTFSRGRINQEFAKEGILPFGHFWSSNKPFGAPSAAVSLQVTRMVPRHKLTTLTDVTVLALLHYFDFSITTWADLQLSYRPVSFVFKPWSSPSPMFFVETSLLTTG
jgi:amino acid transporter